MTAYSKRLIIFDLNNTLVEPGAQMSKDMATAIARLATSKRVAVISGASFTDMQTQFAHALPEAFEAYSNIYLFPNSATSMYVWRGTWSNEYSMHLSPDEKNLVSSALNKAFTLSGYVPPKQQYGPIIDDRGSQITFSGLGKNAPRDLKMSWDPDRSKRLIIAARVTEILPGYEARIGGHSSIDITRRGVNKSYGIRQLERITGIPLDQMEYVGDSFLSNGNDYPAKATGIDFSIVSSPAKALELISSWT